MKGRAQRVTSGICDINLDSNSLRQWSDNPLWFLCKDQRACCCVPTSYSTLSSWCCSVLRHNQSQLQRAGAGFSSGLLSCWFSSGLLGLLERGWRPQDDKEGCFFFFGLPPAAYCATVGSGGGPLEWAATWGAAEEWARRGVVGADAWRLVKHRVCRSSDEIQCDLISIFPCSSGHWSPSSLEQLSRATVIGRKGLPTRK